MSEETQDIITPELRAELVAYLDGELSESETQRVEQTMAKSAAVRREVQLLAGSFELLGTLPRVTASAEFTACTLATVQIEHVDDASPEPRWRRPARRGAAALGWVAALGIASMVGFYGARETPSAASNGLIRDLPVIQDLDMYTEVDSIEFLRELQSSELFDETP